jgi:hypothetical protein
MNRLLLVSCLLFSFCQWGVASSVIRKATLSVTINKYTYTTNTGGLPDWTSSPVCSKQGTINVYSDPADQVIMSLDEYSLVQCDSVLSGAKTSVAFGGFIAPIQTSLPSHGASLKTANLVLSWGDLGSEAPQATSSTGSDNWKNFVAWVVPVSGFNFVNGQIQPPTLTEYFEAAATVIDGN